MLVSRGSLRQFENKQHDPKVQAIAISFIAEQVDLIDKLRQMDGSKKKVYPMINVFKECQRVKVPYISTSCLWKWWKKYTTWGLLPCVVREMKESIRKKQNTRSGAVSKEELLILKQIVDDEPYLYLDEIIFAFGYRTGKFLSKSGISRLLTRKLRYSLKIMSDVAKQRSVEEEEKFLHAMTLLLQGCPERLICIDESHKDRNAARRRRGWSMKNVPCEYRDWFRQTVRYTLIAAADIGGFIPSACHCVLRDHISNEGAAGTVDQKYFLYWVKEYLCPKLGNYIKGEPRSVVFMDNASTHMTPEVVHAIQSTGAVLLYGAPYSPHLNPIEKYFSIYKAYLKRHHSRMHTDWESVHMEALTQVDRDMGIKFYRKCKVPGSYSMFTSHEWEEKLVQFNSSLCNF